MLFSFFFFSNISEALVTKAEVNALVLWRLSGGMLKRQ